MKPDAPTQRDLIERADYIGYVPITRGSYWIFGGSVWLWYSGRASNMGSAADFLAAVEADRIRFVYFNDAARETLAAAAQAIGGAA